jgi:galactokinase
VIDVIARLAEHGMSEPAARAKATLYQRCLAVLASDGSPDCVAFFVPGRIELLGKHTDYAGGRSLLCSLEAGFIMVGRPRNDALVRVTDATSGAVSELSFDGEQIVAPGDWSNYVSTVVRRIRLNFPGARRGADIAFASDLPAASGMSSSSALLIAMFLILAHVNDLTSDALYRREITSPQYLAAYLAAIESGQAFGALAGERGVGTHGGSEDHTAILCCRAGFLSQFAFGPLRFERAVALKPEWSLVVAYSGVAAPKTGSAEAAYNEAAATARLIVSIWNEATARADSTLAAALASGPTAHAQLRHVLTQPRVADASRQPLQDRLEQFVLESDIVAQASAAIAADDFATLGELVDRSQHAAETLLRNQVPETVSLARLARAAGAAAASAFGAGFGGSVWALVETESAQRFANSWCAAYTDAHAAAAAHARFIVTRPGPAVAALSQPTDREV